MEIKAQKARSTLKSLMVLVAISAIFLCLYTRSMTFRNLIMDDERFLDDYLREMQLFQLNMTYLEKNPPKNTDTSLWVECVKIVSEEPYVHPLREEARGFISELAGKRASLVRINHSIQTRMETSSIDAELLRSIRKCILQDYDPKRRNSRTTLFRYHTNGYCSKFNNNIGKMEKTPISMRLGN